jgi:hypothetical protein
VLGRLAGDEAGKEPGLLGQESGDRRWGSGFANGYGSALGPLVGELDIAAGLIDRGGRFKDVV